MFVSYYVGVSYLMPAAYVSLGMRKYVWLGGGWSVPAKTCQSPFWYFKRLGFSHTEEFE